LKIRDLVELAAEANISQFIDILLARTSAKRVQDPAPSQHEINTILNCAVSAPDHGRLQPWRFVIVQKDERQRFGAALSEALRARDPEASPESLRRESEKAMLAAIIIVVAARIKKESKIPEIEQLLSTGAAAQNIMLSAHALGYGAMWKTGKIAYNGDVKRALGLDATDVIAGFIYIGSRAIETPAASRRPAADLVSVWTG
jgi:nitroreductase